MEKISISVNFDNHLTHLTNHINAHIAIFRGFLENLSKTDYGNLRGASFINILVTPISKESLADQEAEKCYKSLITTLQDFMDRMLAVQLTYNKEKIELQINDVNNTSKIHEALLKIENDEFLKISKDQTLNSKNKTHKLLGANIEAKNYLNEYFLLRNSLEHNKGFAKHDIDLKYKRLGVFCDDEEITKAGFITKTGQAISTKIFEEKIIFKKGEKIKLNQVVLENIAFTIYFYIAPEIIRVVSENINKK